MKKQNLKIGDRLLCKESFFDSDDPYFHVDDYCIIYYIQKYVTNEYYYYISDENNKRYPFRFSPDLLLTYFYTKQEIRNMKLKKLEKYE